MDRVHLAGLDHVMVVTAANGKVYMRHYTIAFRKAGTRNPRVELAGMGPSFDFTVR